MNTAQPLDTLPEAFRHGLRPDPIPPSPGWLSSEQRAIWCIAAREGVALGRRLAALDCRDGISPEAAGNLPPQEPPDDLARAFFRGLAGQPLEGRGDG